MWLRLFLFSATALALNLSSGDLDGVYGARFLAFGLYFMTIEKNIFTPRFVEMGEDKECAGLEFEVDEADKIVFKDEEAWQNFLNQLTLKPKKEVVILKYMKHANGENAFTLTIGNYAPMAVTKNWAGTRQRDLHMPTK